MTPDKLGNITLYNCDCMEYMRTLPDKYFSLAITDPPYGINVTKMAYTQDDNRLCRQKNGSSLSVKKEKYKYGDWDNNCPSEEYFTELSRISKNRIIFGVNYFNTTMRGGRIVWDKCNGDNSFSDCEIAYCSLHERVRLFRFMWSGMCQGKDMCSGHIQQGNKKLNQKRIHPTEKPIVLYKWLLKNYAKEGDKIFDSHFGSLSIGIACHDAGFELTACELDTDYYNAGKQRLIDHQKQMRLEF